jgi:hypothetical protein
MTISSMSGGSTVTPAPTPSVSNGGSTRSGGFWSGVWRATKSVGRAAVDIALPRAAVGELFNASTDRAGQLDASMSQALTAWEDSQTRMISQQLRLQKSVATFSTVSNVMKAQHDAEMNAVRNIR